MTDLQPANKKRRLAAHERAVSTLAAVYGGSTSSTSSTAGATSTSTRPPTNAPSTSSHAKGGSNNKGSKKTLSPSSIATTRREKRQRRADENSLLRPLPETVISGAMKRDLQLPKQHRSNPRAYVRSMISELLPSEGKQGSNLTYQSRLENKFLLLENAHRELTDERKEEISVKRALHDQRKFGRRKQRELKVFDVPKEFQKYEQYACLHALWKKYMEDSVLSKFKDLRSQKKREEFNASVLKSDLHGAIITVKRSSTSSFVNVTGIVLQESMKTFKVITPDDKLVLIPKHKAVFTFEACGQLVTLFGSQFMIRPHERSTKKFKLKKQILDF